VPKRTPIPKPSQMRAVAERRFGDASALCATGNNERANGALYLCGFVVEILLKAQLLRTYEQTAKRRGGDVPAAEREIWNLIWRSHDLGSMLQKLPHLHAALRKASERRENPMYLYLKQVCARWDIQLRYSPLSTTMSEAQEVLDRVRVLKEVLKS
jgi:hypothetical protein